ncbi:MAG: tyrosine recombinase XerC [Anaplasma sp.]
MKKILPTIVRDWIQWLREERRYASNTIAAYERDIASFFHCVYGEASEQINPSNIGKLSVVEFRRWLADRCRQGKKSSSNARAVSVVRSLFRYLYYKYGVTGSVVFDVAKPIVRRGLPKVLEQAQARKVVAEPDSAHWTYKRDVAVSALLYGAGLRISEATNIRFRDLGKDELRVLGKGTKERVVPILPWVGHILSAYIESCPYHQSHPSGGEHIFVGVRGKQLSRTYFARRMRALRRQIGLPETTTPHALRHSFATHLVSEGADIRVVQELLGHTNLATTQIYTHLDYNSVINHYRGFHPQTNRGEDSS